MPTVHPQWDKDLQSVYRYVNQVFKCNFVSRTVHEKSSDVRTVNEGTSKQTSENYERYRCSAETNVPHSFFSGVLSQWCEDVYKNQQDPSLQPRSSTPRNCLPEVRKIFWIV
jgi:hypothetical protein